MHQDKNLVLGRVFLLFHLPLSRRPSCVIARTMATKSLIVLLFYYAKFGTLNVYRDPKKVPNSKKIEIFSQRRQWAVPNWLSPTRNMIIKLPCRRLLANSVVSLLVGRGLHL